MQTKPSKQSRGINAAELRHMQWIKDRMICAACKINTPVINHHCEGAMFKNNKIQCGHLFVIGLCQKCDDIVTQQSRRVFREAFGSQSGLWVEQFEEYPNKNEISRETIDAITTYRK